MAISSTTLNEYIADIGQRYSETHRSEVWTVTLQVPFEVWNEDSNANGTPDGWDALPDRGEAPPAGGGAFPVEYNIPAASTLLERHVSFGRDNGDVIVALVYGYSLGLTDVNEMVVTTRTLMMDMPITHAWTAGGVRTQVSGVVRPANGKPIMKEYQIQTDAGYPTRMRMPFQLIRVSGVFDTTKANSWAGELLIESGSVNTATHTLLGKVVAIGQMKYMGSVIDLYRYSSPGNLLYKGYFDWLCHPRVWPRVTRRALYDRCTHLVDATDANGVVIGNRIVVGRKHDNTGYNTDYYICKSYNFTTILTDMLT